MIHFLEGVRLLAGKFTSWDIAGLAVPGFAVPSDHALEHCLDVRGEPTEQSLALFGRSEVRLADMPDRAALSRDPSARRRRERRAKLDRRRVLKVPHEVRREAKHHRRLPLAS